MKMPRPLLHLPSNPLVGAGKDNGKIGKVASGKIEKIEILLNF